jgi:hypothetical protein
MEATIIDAPACAVEQAQVHRTEAASETQGDMGHPDSPAAVSENTRSRDVQPGHRQQVESMRSDRVANALWPTGSARRVRIGGGPRPLAGFHVRGRIQ